MKAQTLQLPSFHYLAHDYKQGLHKIGDPDTDTVAIYLPPEYKSLADYTKNLQKPSID